jgi:DHA1 family tetracycline resistance protein-like MFS transporter
MPTLSALDILGPVICLNQVASNVLMPVRPMIVQRILRRPEQASTALAKLASTAALAEFLITPLMGRLSDTFGRKPFIVGALGLNAAVAALAASASSSSKGHSLASLTLERMLTASSDTVFFTTLRAAMSDSMQGLQLTASAGVVAMWAGAGVFLGPLMSTRVLPALLGTADPTAVCYLFNALVYAASAAVVHRRLRETLPEQERKPMDWAAANPLNFLKVTCSLKVRPIAAPYTQVPNQNA